MTRRYSDLERSNLAWFKSDDSVASLKAIEIRKGEIRGLKRIRFDFDYPLTAIAGKNGCGKSTVIALAACAFHNGRGGWKLPDRATSYYTFSDFFVQARGERSVDGISVWYLIHYDSWQPNARFPDGSGLGWQERSKRKGGRWTDYDRRANRPVAFLGIERVVPTAEKSVFRSYRQRFSSRERSGFEGAVCTAVSRVLGVPYDSFEFREHGKYRLPWVQRRRGAGYSGFNMGAGEKALFEFFAAILSAPRGALFLVDEIELGLHEQAQAALVRVLSELCLERHIQIICTTHSPIVLGALPFEARLYLDSGVGVASVVPGVSVEFAAGRMSGKNSEELVVYVEDSAAVELVTTSIPGKMRSRIRVCPIGSNIAVINALATRFKDSSLGPVIAFLDGDQRAAKQSHIKRFLGLVEGKDGDPSAWIHSRLEFLPGEFAPEIMVLSKLRDLDPGTLETGFNFDGVSIVDAIDSALMSGDHNEIHAFSQAMHQGKPETWRDACRLLVRELPEEVSMIGESIENALLENVA